MGLTRINNQALPTLDSGKFPSGTVLQVKQTLKTNTTSFATNGTFADITGLSVSITPTSTSSKILVNVDISVGQTNQSYAKGRLMRGSTAIGVGDAATGEESTFSLNTSRYSGSYERNHDNASVMYLDSPSTTSSTTYKVQANTYGNRAIYINYNDGDANVRANTISTITVMEIAG